MRLQSFPDEFLWSGSRIEVARQVGNAVPCLLANAVAVAVTAMLSDDTRSLIGSSHWQPSLQLVGA
jgi:site-specific DNA-cytosine methylase